VARRHAIPGWTARLIIALAISLIVSIAFGFTEYALTFSLRPLGGITDSLNGCLKAACLGFALVFSYFFFFEALRFVWEFPNRKNLRAFEELVRKGEELLDRR
jgi:hypothetical protein